MTRDMYVKWQKVCILVATCKQLGQGNDDLEITFCDDTASKPPRNIRICHYSDNNRSIHGHLCPQIPTNTRFYRVNIDLARFNLHNRNLQNKQKEQ